LQDWADAVVVQSTGDDLVLVGHSFGGVTLPLAAQALGDRVRHVVFVSAAVLLHGQDVFEAFPRGLATLARWTSRRNARDGLVPPNLRNAARSFCHDMAPEQAAFTLERLSPEALRPSLEKAVVTMADLPALPRTYVRLAQDQVFSPKRQSQRASRLGEAAPVVTLDAGHDVMISRPQQLADVLNRL
jgi:pimeloyl-ACP methyl ester carboxylesterase